MCSVKQKPVKSFCTTIEVQVERVYSLSGHGPGLGVWACPVRPLALGGRPGLDLLHPPPLRYQSRQVGLHKGDYLKAL